MKKKLTTLLFGLLLAVGWTSNASAQALPEGGFTKRMGLPDVGVNSGIVNATKRASSAQSMLMLPSADNSTSESTQMSAPAQAPKRITGVSSVVHDKAYYQQFKYSWTGADGVRHENVDPTEPATDPYQIYELLRFVYGNPNFPGPTHSAYTPNYQREDPVYYGAINGGWDITAGTGGATVNTKDITITVANYYASITSITVYNANSNAQLVNWDAATATANSDYYRQYNNGSYYYYYNLPTGWTTNPSNSFGMVDIGGDNSNVYAAYIASGESDPGTITIPYSALNGATEVRVVINAATDEGSTSTIQVNDGTTESLTTTVTTYTWDLTVAEQPEEGAYVQGTVVAPYQDGYTVVLVALKDRAEMKLATEEWPANSSHFETKAQLIEYFSNNIEYVRLLTDGLRIGEGLNTGTVFNCDGRLNRFFFLGKGQSRKKAPRILDFINRGTVYFNSFTANKQNYSGYIRYYDWFGEDVAFEEMYEQFSPTSTTVSDASQTLDLFDKLREGNVYDVQHDCGSVMQAEHEFSLAGKDGTEHFPFSGLNFFVPDYRLLFWTAKDTVGSTIYTVDGRDNVPYQRANTNYTTPEGSHGNYFSGVSDGGSNSAATWYSAWSAYYAVYNKTYAPKIGIYRITLDAVATFVGDATNPDHSPSNHNYNVTLTWVSSLNQMSGSNVPQTYTMYLVDENGNRTQLEPTDVKFYDKNGNELDENNQNPFHVTQAVYAVPQNEHSYTIEYQVDGVADAGPAFHATSNRASVVIPGWNDFVGLQLDHHESDFVITKNQQTGQSSERHNWYRNFVAVINEDIFNGLTVSKINGTSDDGVKMNEFNLYRFLYDSDGKPSTETKVATITFDQATEKQAHFTVAYQNQEIEDYTLKYKEGNNTVTVDDAYSRANLDIPEEGWVRVKGNGDIVIWPNSYTVNFKSIRVYNGNSTTPISGASWTAPNAFPSGWYTSPGSKWENYTTEAGDQVGYIEGGGYIAIPNLLNNYPNARVVIEAYGDAGYTNRIAVNDLTQNITATAAGTNYTWATPSPAAAPKRAGETQTITESFEDENVFPSFGLGGITATQHTGAFGQWKLYDSTGANVWPASDLEWDNSGKPQAWMPFNGSTVHQADAYTGNKYMESVVPTSGSADSWLISPELSGNAQTITFYERIFTTKYQPETYEVLYSTTDNEPSSFTRAQTINSYETTWKKRSVSLPEGAKYFAIRHTSSSAKFGMMIDDVTYEISNEAPAAEGGLLRLHLLMVDQLNERIPDDNSHPDAYGYVLRWEQPENKEDHKQSGTVRVNIQKTDCEVLSYYTLDQIDRDTKRDLTMDALTADVEFNLSPSNDLLNYYNLQAKENNEPAFNEGYVTRLHRQENFTYREMLETSPNLGEVYPNGEHHYFDDSTPIETGVYGVKNRFMSYAPSVSTWGVQRRYFEYDGLDNTYGAPIWKTTVGKVTLDKVDIERQHNKNNSVNWEDQGGNASLFMLDNIEATGYLPHTDLTKVEFEPYMFRVFVESENGLLRPYKVVEAVEGSATAGEHLAPKDGELTEADKKGPLCVWSGYITPDGKGGFVEENGAQITLGKESGQTTYIYHKNKVDRTGGSDANPLPEWDQDATNAKFGALDALAITGYDNSGKPILKTAIDEKDLKVYVRFYYNVKGTAEGHTPWINMHTAGGSQSRVGNGSEAESGVTGIATAVHEVQYLGEIVSQTYYNVQGMESDKPFKGVNIVVTRFSDGTVSTTKVVK